MSKHPNFSPVSYFSFLREREVDAFQQGAEYGHSHWCANFTRVLKRMRQFKQQNETLRKQLFMLGFEPDA